MGRPYVYAAKGPNAFDCSGYTSYIMRQFGIMVSPGSRHQATQGRHVDLAAAKVGDLLYFSAYGRGGVITHVGLIIGNDAEVSPFYSKMDHVWIILKCHTIILLEKKSLFARV